MKSSQTITQILEQLKSGFITTEAAEKMIELQHNTSRINQDPSDVLSSFANLDHSRSKRTRFPEAIFSQGKTPKQIAAILDDMAGNVNELVKMSPGISLEAYHKAILATRVDKRLYEEIIKHPLHNGTITYHEVAKIISMKASSLNGMPDDVITEGHVVVACAGTTDLPVAEEACKTLEAAGCKVERIYDVGVAGLHRIINALPRLRDPSVDCVIVCAGMDGALPSVVAGLVSCPVVAVPTSIGYGASFSGVSALLTMLNSCAPGVGVVNIDNGFGGAALAFKCVEKKKAKDTNSK